jgi:hypothetical protein
MIKRLIGLGLLAVAGYVGLKRLDARRYPTLNLETGRVEPTWDEDIAAWQAEWLDVRRADEEFGRWLQQPPTRVDHPDIPVVPAPGEPLDAMHARQQEEFAAYLARRSRIAYEYEEKCRRLLEATGITPDELDALRRRKAGE